MKNVRAIRILLLLAGIIGLIIGGAQLLIPVSFEASAGIEPGNNSSLLSEIRAAGGTLFTAGIVIIRGAFFSGKMYLALIFSTVFYLSYGFARAFSVLMDGIPAESLVIAMITEIIIGVLSFIAWYGWRKKVPTELIV